MSLFKNESKENNQSNSVLDNLTDKENQLKYLVNAYYPNWYSKLMLENKWDISYKAYSKLAKIFDKYKNSVPSEEEIAQAVIDSESDIDLLNTNDLLDSKLPFSADLCPSMINAIKDYQRIKSNSLIKQLPSLPDEQDYSKTDIIDQPTSFMEYLQSIASQYHVSPIIDKLLKQACLQRAQQGYRNLELFFNLSTNKIPIPVSLDRELLTAQIVNYVYKNKIDFNPYQLDNNSGNTKVFQDFATNIKKFALQNHLVLKDYSSLDNPFDLLLSWDPDNLLDTKINQQNKQLKNQALGE